MFEQKTVHIIGAGMAGLSSAVYLASHDPKIKIKLYEASNRVGGRCYSFYDQDFDRILDNCPHLILGVNKNLLHLLDLVNGLDNLTPVDPPFYPFADVRKQKIWILQPFNRGFLPFWIFYPPKRIPESSVMDYLAFFKLWRTKKNATVEAILGTNPIYQSFWLPFCKAVLNTHPEHASARLLYQTVFRIFGRGKKNCIPYLTNKSLNGTLIEPVLQYLSKKNVEIIYNKKIRGLGIEEKVDRLFFAKDKTYIGDDDAVILATTAENTYKMLPSISTPQATSPIVCIHFLVDDHFTLPKKEPFYGIVGSIVEWIFMRKNLLSVVLSAPSLETIEMKNEDLAQLVWEELLRIPAFPAIDLPQYRVIKEHKATILHTAKNESLRKKAATPFANLFLAGDWTDTSIPSSLESAVTSGFNAGEQILKYFLKTEQ